MDAHEEFFRSLPREEVHLLALREILYEGSWEEMVRDLEARKEGRPHVYKLQSRIEEDLESIRKLQSYEAQHDVHLGKYISQEVLAGGRRAG
jgi:hypothetical protein